MYKKRIHLNKELEISSFKIEKEHELTEKKLAFFTNISHDLKTPLTLISAPVRDLLQSGNLESGQLKKLEVINRNAERLYKLISDLVDFRKITQNQLPLHVSPVNIQPYIENIYESFILECQLRDIDFTFSCDINHEIYADIKKIEKILWNLLANALKFTDQGGSIQMKVRIEGNKGTDSHVILEVSDTGKGFTEEEKHRIFDRFYQIRKSENIHFEGSGIGLSIVYDLTKLHHGEIEVNSMPGKGSRFIIRIPCEANYYSTEERKERTGTGTEDVYSRKLIPDVASPEKEEETGITRYSLPKMLIVEDNMELLQYLCSHFEKNYKVCVANNGIEGLKKVSEKEPDIIITDIIMPELNGYQFCKQVKNNFNSSHIPVIMLTANHSTDQIIEGLSCGADSYIAKPFDIQHLDATAQALLKNRKKVREKYLGVDKIELPSDRQSGEDIRFVNELKEFILKNITSEELNVEMLSGHFSVSRSQLNRKIKALTNLTPNNYIKMLRLKKAYELIKTKGYRVAEAAYMTGFSDPNYFTICFTREFGENPSKIASG